MKRLFIFALLFVILAFSSGSHTGNTKKAAHSTSTRLKTPVSPSPKIIPHHHTPAPNHRILPKHPVPAPIQPNYRLPTPIRGPSSSHYIPRLPSVGLYRPPTPTPQMGGVIPHRLPNLHPGGPLTRHPPRVVCHMPPCHPNIGGPRIPHPPMKCTKPPCHPNTGIPINPHPHPPKCTKPPCHPNTGIPINPHPHPPKCTKPPCHNGLEDPNPSIKCKHPPCHPHPHPPKNDPGPKNTPNNNNNNNNNNTPNNTPNNIPNVDSAPQTSAPQSIPQNTQQPSSVPAPDMTQAAQPNSQPIPQPLSQPIPQTLPQPPQDMTSQALSQQSSTATPAEGIVSSVMQGIPPIMQQVPPIMEKVPPIIDAFKPYPPPINQQTGYPTNVDPNQPIYAQSSYDPYAAQQNNGYYSPPVAQTGYQPAYDPVTGQPVYSYPPNSQASAQSNYQEGYQQQGYPQQVYQQQTYQPSYPAQPQGQMLRPTYR